jgi:hypothetical protein
MTEQRTRTVARDLNDLVRDPNGRVAEAKVFAVIFKPFLLWVFMTNAQEVLRDWGILTVIVVTFVAPDLLKKLIAMRSGIPDGESRTTEYRRESTSTSTVAKDDLK